MADFELRCTTWLNAKEIRERVQKASIDATAKAALMVEAEAKRLLSKGGKRPGTAQLGDKKVPVVHESGPKGQPPRLRTGNLRASIRTARTSRGTYIVGPTTTAWYGRIHEREHGTLVKLTPKMRGFLFHEFGWRISKNKSHLFIPPRPFMTPALRNVMTRFPKLFTDMNLGTDMKGPTP